MHISIIGAGQIGRLAGFNLLTDSALFKTGARRLTKLTFIDRKEMEFEGHRRDLLDAAHINGLNAELVYAHDTNMEAVKGSDVIVVTASASLAKHMKREDLLGKNRAIAEHIGRGLAAHAPQAFIIVVSNPLDIMVALIQHYAQCPKNMICGSGPLLDTVRAWRILPKYLSGDKERARQAKVLGQHGAAMIAVIDKLNLADYDAAREEVVNEGYAIARFNNSSYAPAANIIELLRAYICDKSEVLPVCAFYGEAYIGALATISAKGVSNIHMPEMSERERRENMSCIAHLQKIVAETIAAGT